MNHYVKRLLKQLHVQTFPAEVADVARQRIREIVEFHIETTNARTDLVNKMHALGLSCYTQGLCDGASEEVITRLHNEAIAEGAEGKGEG